MEYTNGGLNQFGELFQMNYGGIAFADING